VDCCTPEAAPPAAVTDCPACGARGRRVKPVTLDALVHVGTARKDASYRFCATVGCDVAWFGESTGHHIPVSASRVRIGQKETTPDRRLCYCFGYSAADVTEQVARTGTSTIPDAIAEHCRNGEDRCPETNPQGACCLGNVRAAMKSASAVDGCGCSITGDAA
jgi:hypothetical protein